VSCRFFCVEAHLRTERERHLVLDVTERETGHDRDVQREEVLAEHRLQFPVRHSVRDRGKTAQDDAGDRTEHAGMLELKQHAVESVRALPDILEKENPS
jgi:hypothetical protein